MAAIIILGGSYLLVTIGSELWEVTLGSFQPASKLANGLANPNGRAFDLESAAADSGLLANPSQNRHYEARPVPHEFGGGDAVGTEEPVAGPESKSFRPAATDFSSKLSTRVAKLPAVNKSDSFSIASEVRDAPDHYFVQLASLRSEGEALNQMASLKGRYQTLLPIQAYMIRQVDLGDKGIYFRVLAGPYLSRFVASAYCAELLSEGQGCLVLRQRQAP